MTTTGEIMSEMEATRADIRATLAELENRVSVDALLQRVITPARMGTIEFRRAFGEAARDNPVALGMAAIGLGWLMFGRGRHSGSAGGNGGRGRFDERRLDPARPLHEGLPGAETRMARAMGAVDDGMEAARMWTRDKVNEASETIRRSADAARETVGEASDAVRHSVAEASEAVRDTTAEAADAAKRSAAAARKTANEASDAVRRKAGEASDAVRRSAGAARATVSGVAADAVERSTEAARSTASHASETMRRTAEAARERAGHAGDALKHSVGTVRETAVHAGDALKRSAGAARETADHLYQATRTRAGKAAGRVRDNAGIAGDYMREHPILVGAAVFAGGALLAYMLARRTRVASRAWEAEEELPADIPETPYASGKQADMSVPHRNEPIPVTPEDEEPVLAYHDVSAVAEEPDREEDERTADAREKAEAAPAS